MRVEYFKPKLSDIPQMQEVVKSYVLDGTILNRTQSEMATTIRSYTIAKLDNKIIGFIALHIHTVSLAEIRSLIVDKNYRELGVGKRLVELATLEAKELEVEEILVLTYHREFFEKLNFREIPKDAIPDSKIWADCIKCKHFPICNEISLTKEI